MHITDLLCCTAETNITVKQLYSNKNLFKKQSLMLTILWVPTGRAQWGPLLSDLEQFRPHLEWI